MNSTPKKLAIYYGWPSLINGTGVISLAITEFNNYDLVVLGAGLEDPTHADHQNTIDIISGSTAEFYGYIDSTLTVNNIEKKVDRWKAMGANIFFDRCGFDFGLTRQKQNEIIDYAHNAGLTVFIHAWDPDDVFKTVSGLDTHLIVGDWYLAASHYVKEGVYQDTTEWETKSDKMNTYKSVWGISMACCTTTTVSVGFDQNMWDAAYYAHAVYGFDASGWGEANYSATDSQLPWRARVDIKGTKIIGPLIKNSPIFERKTNIGIQVDAASNTVCSLTN